MVRPGRDRLRGVVEVDETYIGGDERDVRGRETYTKALIGIAAEEQGDGIGRIRLATLPNASRLGVGGIPHAIGWQHWLAAFVPTDSLMCQPAASDRRRGNVRYIRVFTHLGYPLYFMTIIGIWYTLAGVALLVPRFPRVKEWAYAGLIVNYTGAAASPMTTGDGLARVFANDQHTLPMQNRALRSYLTARPRGFGFSTEERSG
jgi:uncharacterized membrane protein YphA (DoxX/SURF4 family)